MVINEEQRTFRDFKRIQRGTSNRIRCDNKRVRNPGDIEGSGRVN